MSAETHYFAMSLVKKSAPVEEKVLVAGVFHSGQYGASRKLKDNRRQ
eukprot:CAMPEP_0172562254 /NCGR_PEP_ID=MMETSP1067-20121228/96251_1 /TAXON_ID=265564 ORGANISM="Thalassiosira punctigera, Strain Tpunct2005C2" /NCGR_SAMPLE_ID=MMETSP1067 /ASSEMBLY_ACC=CAM_ASM_000444 /LENGTH=46 /DNA_ID= /DNA_START= /DNA_END= /DNA_ORIENTATION=